MSRSISPNSREILSARSTITGNQEYLTSTNGILNTSSSGGGGGAVTIADGADVALGATTDAAVTAGSTGTVSGKLRQISSDISSLKSTLPLPTGAATAANQSTEISSLSTIATNTGNGATSANQTNGNQQTKLTDGTNVVNVLKSDGTAAGQNAELIAGTYLSVPFTTTTVQAVGTTDAANYRWVSVHVVSQGTSSSIAFQSSNDNTNWTSLALVNASSVGIIPQVSTGTSSQTYHGPLAGRYFRLNVTGISAGTTSGTIIFSTLPSASQTVGAAVVQSGTWTVGSNSATGSAVPTNAFYLGMADASSNLIGLRAASNQGDVVTGAGQLSVSSWLYNGTNYDRSREIINATNSTGTGIAAVGLTAQLDDVSPTTITENQFGNLRIDTARQLRVNNQLSPDATLLNTYSVHITTNTTTTPTSSTAYISSISISNEVGGTTSTITIQDKQGTPLKLVNGVATTALTTAPTVINFQTPVKMVSGIDIITAGAAAATVDVWINYYQ